jgi:hypothetical protein
MRFRTTVELGGKTATGFRVPAEVVEALGAGKKPRVHVAIGGYTYRSTVAVYGGQFMLPLNAGNRERAGVAAGDQIEVELQLDTEPREVSVPADLAAALQRERAAAQRFDALSYSHKREYVDSINAAKRLETRQRRIAKTIDTLRMRNG